MAAADTDERDLIEAAKVNPASFAELYERNFDRVWAFVIRRVTDRAEAEDITSEVFHDALRGIAKFEWRGTPFVAWLYRIAANEIADRAKKAGRNLLMEEQEVAFDAGVEQRAMLYQLVRELPDTQREVIVKRFVERATVAEIAQQMGRSEGAIKQLQHRALEALRARTGASHG